VLVGYTSIPQATRLLFHQHWTRKSRIIEFFGSAAEVGRDKSETKPKMLSKLSENQCLEISKWCLNYILNHGIHEKGLFRLSTASMNDIRRFKQQLSEGIIYHLFALMS
jgi:hypothetical protein